LTWQTPDRPGAGPRGYRAARPHPKRRPRCWSETRSAKGAGRKLLWQARPASWQAAGLPGADRTASAGSGCSQRGKSQRTRIRQALFERRGRRTKFSDGLLAPCHLVILPWLARLRISPSPRMPSVGFGATYGNAGEGAMAAFRIAVIGGDGIGPEVIEQA